MAKTPSPRIKDDIAVTKLSSPRIFLVRMLVFLILCALLTVVLYKQIWTAFLANPGLNALIGAVLLIGIILSAAKLLYTFSNLTARLEPSAKHGSTVLSLEGTATFLRLPVLANALEQVPPDTELHVDLERLDYIDHACLDLLMNWAKQHEAVGGRLVIDWDSLHAQFNPESLQLKKSVA